MLVVGYSNIPFRGRKDIRMMWCILVHPLKEKKLRICDSMKKYRF